MLPDSPTRQSPILALALAGVALLLLAALVLAACTDKETVATPTATRTETETPPPVATTVPSGLTEYDYWSPLMVKGRDRLRACVEVLEDDVNVEDVASAIEAALLAATEDPRWPDEFGTPAVDVGCPLPPAALEETDKPLLSRAICRAEVSPYLVYVFVAETSRFTERFQEEFVRLTLGTRKASQEVIPKGQGSCNGVAEAWYLTPDEFGDADLLQRYIFGEFGIFPIAELCC